MTPKEKAMELIELFHQCMYHDMGAGVMGYVNRARQCAVICCDELIKDNETAKIAYDGYGAYEDRSDLAFWSEVKRELQRL